MRIEKRRNPRETVNWPVMIQTKACFIERLVYNISPDGTFIAGLSGLEPQEVVGMTIMEGIFFPSVLMLKGVSV